MSVDKIKYIIIIIIIIITAVIVIAIVEFLMNSNRITTSNLPARLPRLSAGHDQRLEV